MNYLRCKNGHYYDADNYATCPHCQDGAATPAAPAAQAPTVPDRTMPLQNPGVFPAAAPMMDYDDKTQPILRGGPAPMQGGPARMPGGLGETVPITGGLDGDDKTQAFSYPDMPVSFRPIVGWLVCVRGAKFRGQSFPLIDGKNGVSRVRSDQCSIVLTGEESVSRSCHAIVVFEPKENKFFVLPGNSRELCYVNGSVVLTSSELKKNDRLSVGQVTLMLIPCCDDAFSWLKEN